MDNPSPKTLPKDFDAWLSKIEMPWVRSTLLIPVAVFLALLWLVAFWSVPYLGNWGLALAGIITFFCALTVFLVWRFVQDVRSFARLLRQAADSQKRTELLQKLRTGQVDEFMDALSVILPRAQGPFVRLLIKAIVKKTYG